MVEHKRPGNVGIILRQVLICQALKDGSKTVHGIGEQITKLYRKLPAYMTCTWIGGEREPIESRINMREDETMFCRNLEKEIEVRNCIGCHKHVLRDLAPTSIFKNIETLIGHGIVSEAQENEGNKKRSVYTLNQGCFDGIIVLKTHTGELLVTICPNILCEIHANDNKREITEKCIYYAFIFKKEPIIKVKL